MDQALHRSFQHEVAGGSRRRGTKGGGVPDLARAGSKRGGVDPKPGVERAVVFLQTGAETTAGGNHKRRTRDEEAEDSRGADAGGNGSATGRDERHAPARGQVAVWLRVADFGGVAPAGAGC